MSDMKDILKNNTPEFLKTYDSLVNYIEAVGEFMQETKDSIEGFDNSHDYEKGSPFQLANSLKSVGFEIPPYLDQDVSRVVLRDAIHLFIKKGTLDSLVWVLKVLGLSPIIRQAWLPSPVDVRKGKIRDISTGSTSRYDVNKFSYTDFLYGEEETSEDGTFFKGYKYDDFYQSNELDPIPIFGHQYRGVVDSETFVEKLPYVIIRVTDQDFNVVTEPYVDEETGEVYEYSVSEEFKAVEDMLDYFLFQTSRSANVRIILIASLQTIDEEVNINSPLVQTQDGYVHGLGTDISGVLTTLDDEQQSQGHDLFDSEATEDILGIDDTHSDEAKTDSIGAVETYSDVSTTEPISGFSIGDPINIGNGSPYISQYDVFTVGTIAETSQTYITKNYEDFDTNTVDTYFASDANGVGDEIAMKAGSFLGFTANGTDIEVYGKNYYGSGETPVLITTVNSSESINLQIPVEYHSVQFVSPTGDQFDIPVQINY